MDQSICRVEIVVLAIARVGELLEILLSWPGLRVNESEACDVDVVVNILVQVQLVNIQAGD